MMSDTGPAWVTTATRARPAGPDEFRRPAGTRCCLHLPVDVTTCSQIRRVESRAAGQSYRVIERGATWSRPDYSGSRGHQHTDQKPSGRHRRPKKPWAPAAGRLGTCESQSDLASAVRAIERCCSCRAPSRHPGPSPAGWSKPRAGPAAELECAPPATRHAAHRPHPGSW